MTIAVFAVIVGCYAIFEGFRNKPELSTIKEVDSVTKLIEFRPQYLALIRCAPSERNENSNLANWSACGIIGAVPKYEQKISIFGKLLKVNFIDNDGVTHKSQNWELVSLNLNKNDAQIVSANVVQALSKWQNANKWIRDIEQQELSEPSPVLRHFYAALGGKNGDIGKLPWNRSKAYVDRRILKMEHGVPLFETNGELIELASLETGKSPYTPQHFPVPKTLSEYSSYNQNSWLYPEPYCEGASRQALLVHEPHQRPGEEEAFFFLLAYLQEQYPATFGELHVFQEGQPNNLSTSDSVFALPVSGFEDTIIKMLEDSHNAWNSSLYAPLNRELNLLEDDVRSFLKAKNLPTSRIWDEAINFYNFQEESGALDTRAAIENNLHDRIKDRYRIKDREIASTYVNRFKNLEVNDAAFAENLVEENGFRGALAYELYVEGNASPISGNSVSVYGLDDERIYYASFALLLSEYKNSLIQPNSSRKSTIEPKDWKAIQPFRDWIMARTVVKKLKSLDQSVVPVVAAAAATHLPLVREFLCEAGIGTVTLRSSASLTKDKIIDNHIVLNGVEKSTNLSFTPMKSWQPPSNWHGTTPIMGYFTSSLSSALPDMGSLRLPTEEPGISQMLDTWITDPGLF